MGEQRREQNLDDGYMRDLTIELDEWTVNIRVGAIVSHGARILLCRLPSYSWWFLPGGRVRTGESSHDALHRELSEELGEHFAIVRPIICSENFFHHHGQQFHEICTYYDVRWNGGEQIIQQPDAQEIFNWVERQKIGAEDLKPSFLKTKIANPSHELELVIHHDQCKQLEKSADGNMA